MASARYVNAAVTTFSKALRAVHSGPSRPLHRAPAAIVQTCSAALAVADLLTARYGEAWMTHPTSFRKEDD